MVSFRAFSSRYCSLGLPACRWQVHEPLLREGGAPAQKPTCCRHVNVVIAAARAPARWQNTNRTAWQQLQSECNMSPRSHLLLYLLQHKGQVGVHGPNGDPSQRKGSRPLHLL